MDFCDDISISLSSAKMELKKIEKYCKRSDKSTINSLKISVKHYFGDLNSTLDYLGNQMYREIYGKESTRTYFPIFNKDNNSFKSNMGQSFPDLEIKKPQIYSLLEGIQYYNDYSNREWMKELHEKNNAIKHRHLSKHQVKKSIAYNIGTEKYPNAFGFETTNKKGFVAVIDCSCGEQKLDDVVYHDGRITILKKNDDSRTIINKTTKTNFYFTESNKPVIPSLHTILQGVDDILDKFKNIALS